LPTEQLTKKLTGESHLLAPGVQTLPQSPQRPAGEGIAKSIARTACSFTCQLLSFLLATYLLLWTFYPWRPLAELDIPAWMVKFASDTAQMVRDSQAPIITLGTSLIGAPVGRLKRPNLYGEVLSAAAGKNLPADLLSSPGAIIADQAFIVHELFSHHKKPTLIILTYGARDFMDNEVADRISITPTRRVVSFINKRQSLLPGAMTWSAFSDCFSSHALFVDLVRRHWLKTLSVSACKVSGHPMTLWDGARMIRYRNEMAEQMPPVEATADDATEEQKEASERAKVLRLDLELYNRRYNPYNERRTTVQLHYLADLLDECQQHGVQVQMIGMPVSPANQRLLKPGRYEALDAKIRVLAARYNAGIIDINKMPGVKFEQDDFVDSVHLTESGSRHFIPIFAQCVLNSPSFRLAFPKTTH
jgi:hypothetical protein